MTQKLTGEKMEENKKDVTLMTAEREKVIVRTSIIGILANVLLAGFKAAIGLATRSIAVTLDAVNNLSDALSSVITIVGTKLSKRPADRQHPFGHGRIEYLTAIIIAVIVLSAGITSLIESGQKLFHPTTPNYTTITLVIIIVSVLVKIVLGQYVKKKGEQLKSDALIASGADALFDAVVTLSTLVSAAIMLIWHVSLDGILGALISLLIIKAGFEMLSSPINELLGARISPDLVANIKKEVMGFKGVHGVYDIILHNYGPDVIIGSLHINVYDTMSAEEIHHLTRRITESLNERYGIIMTVGIYAIGTGDKKMTKIQNAVLQSLAAHKDITQVHGFAYFADEGRISVDVVPDISVTDEKAFAQTLTNEIQSLYPNETITVIVDHNYTA